MKNKFIGLFILVGVVVLYFSRKKTTDNRSAIVPDQRLNTLTVPEKTTPQGLQGPAGQQGPAGVDGGFTPLLIPTVSNSQATISSGFVTFQIHVEKAWIDTKRVSNTIQVAVKNDVFNQTEIISGVLSATGNANNWSFQLASKLHNSTNMADYSFYLLSEVSSSLLKSTEVNHQPFPVAIGDGTIPIPNIANRENILSTGTLTVMTISGLSNSKLAHNTIITIYNPSGNACEIRLKKADNTSTRVCFLGGAGNERSGRFIVDCINETLTLI